MFVEHFYKTTPELPDEFVGDTANSVLNLIPRSECQN